MPFWSKGNSNNEAPASKDFTSSDESAFSTGNDSLSSSSVGSSSLSGGVGGGGAAAAAEIQQFMEALQSQMVIQETISGISKKAFEKCVTKPGDSLSGKEAACVQAVTLKWIDTSMFLSKRLEKKMAAGQNQASF